MGLEMPGKVITILVSALLGGIVGWVIPKAIHCYVEKTALQKVRYPYRKMAEVFLNALSEPAEDFYIITGDGSSFLGLSDPWVYIVLIAGHARMKIVFTHYVEETKGRVKEYINTLESLGVNQVKIVNIARGITEKGLQAAGINEDRSIIWIKVNVDETGKTEVPVGGKTKYYRKYVGWPLKFPCKKVLQLFLRVESLDELKTKYQDVLTKKMQKEFFIPEDKIDLLPKVIDSSCYESTKTEHRNMLLCKISPYLIQYDTRKQQFYYETPVIKEHTSRDLVKLILGYFNLQ